MSNSTRMILFIVAQIIVIVAMLVSVIVIVTNA